MRVTVQTFSLVQQEDPATPVPIEAITVRQLSESVSDIWQPKHQTFLNGQFSKAEMSPRKQKISRSVHVRPKKS